VGFESKLECTRVYVQLYRGIVSSPTSLTQASEFRTNRTNNSANQIIWHIRSAVDDGSVVCNPTPCVISLPFRLLLMTTSKSSKAPIRYIVDDDSDPCVRLPCVILLAFKDLASGSHSMSTIRCRPQVSGLQSDTPCYFAAFLNCCW